MLSFALLDPWALDPTGARLLLELAFKGTILLAGAALVTGLWRDGAAAAKHWVWVVSMGSVLILPVLVEGMPRWRIPASLPLVEVIAAQTPVQAPLAAAASVGYATPAPADFAVPGFAPSLSWERRLMIAWAAGAALLLGLLLIAHVRIVWLTSRAWPVCSERCDELVDRLCRRLGIRRAPMLIETGADAMPMTWGLLRPVIALPRGAADDWPEQRLEAVLLHQLAHLRRRDIPVQLMAQIVCALHWFNPLAWHALQRIRLESEKACDDVVLAQGVKPSVYAEYLLGLARAQGSRRAPALAGMPMAEPSQLPVRLRALLSEAQRRGRASLALLSGLLLAGAMAACVVASASPVTADGARAHSEERAARASRSDAQPLSVPVAERTRNRLEDGDTVYVSVEAASPRRVEGSGPSAAVRYQALPLSPGDTVRPVLMNAGEVRAAVERNYPSALRRAGLSGTALLEMRIDTRGRVSEIRVMNASDPAFGEAASRSLAEARFAPARTGDGPIAMQVLWPVAFNAIDSDVGVARIEPAARYYEVAEAPTVAVERAMAATTARARRVAPEVEAVERVMAATTARPRRVAAEVEVVERAMAATTARPRRVAPELEEVERAVAVMSARAPRVAPEVEAVERAVAVMSARAPRVASEVEAVERAVAVTSARARRVAPEVEPVERVMAVTTARASRVAPEVEAVERAVAVTSARARRVAPEVEAVERAMAATTARPRRVVPEMESLERPRSCPNMILDAWRDTAAVERALRSARPRNPIIVIDGTIATDSELQALGIQAGVPLDGSEKIRELTVLHDTRQLLGTNIPGGVVCIYPS